VPREGLAEGTWQAAHRLHARAERGAGVGPAGVRGGNVTAWALEVLVDVVPHWLVTWLPVEWGMRYGRQLDTYRLPKDEAVRQQLTLQVGTDGYATLRQVYGPDAPGWLREVPAIETLRQVWVQQYQMKEEQVQWRANTELPPAAL